MGSSPHTTVPSPGAVLLSDREVAGEAPERVTTDGHDAYPWAIREELGETVLHRTNRYLNN